MRAVCYVEKGADNIPSIKVAFSDKDNPKTIEVETKKGKKEKKVPKRLASGSATTIKKEMAAYPGTKWTVAVYNFKPSVENIIQVIVDLPGMEAEESTDYKVTESGQVRKI